MTAGTLPDPSTITPPGQELGRTDDEPPSAPNAATVQAVTLLAAHAPAIANSMSLRWRSDGHAIHLLAGSLPSWPAHRENARNLIGCGAALHHARIALAAFGWAGPIRRFPSPADIARIASIDLRATEPTDDAIAMVSAIIRRSERHDPVSEVSHRRVQLITEQVSRSGAVLVPVYDHGIANPARDVPAQRATEAGYGHRRRCFALTATAQDSRSAALMAGEALSAAVLTATRLGLRCTVHSPPESAPIYGGDRLRIPLTVGGAATFVGAVTPPRKVVS